MKTLEANNLLQAKKELIEIDKNLVEKLNENVNYLDRKHYHVILVKVIDRPGQPKNDVSMIVQTYNKTGFETLKKNFVFQGFTQAILLHSPVVDEPVLENIDNSTVFDTEKDNIIANQTKELSDKDAEIEALKSKLETISEPDSTNKVIQTGGGDIDPINNIDFEEFNVIEADFKALNIFAAKNKIDLQKKKSTEDIRVVVANWIKAQA